jgi:glutamate-1-semialdehyde 2,1-aminomutase
MGLGQELYEKGRTLIPGGTQLLSKRPEMFLPGQWPAYYARAKGVEVWDLDGRKYVDATSCGVGAPILGYADPDVESAVIGAVRAGNMCTLNCPEEVELAELLIELHPWADMVRYSRAGGEALAVAIRIARAQTGRDKIVFCGYHGWTDWYLAANLSEEHALDGHLLPGLAPAGVPRGLTGTMLPFHYNDIGALRAIIEQHGHDLAAIILEPARSSGPAPGFLEEIRSLATKIGAVLVFDEVTSGWRMTTGGIHLLYGVDPDMATFAKAIGNGYPMAAIIGRREIMDAAQRTFISSTNWTERIGPTAALATIRKHRKENVPAHLIRIGEMVQEGWTKAAAECGLPIHVSGIAPLSHFEIECERPQAMATLFIQEMLRRGYLAATQFYITYSHSQAVISSYLDTVREVFGVLAEAARIGDAERRLAGPVKHSGFQRLN